MQRSVKICHLAAGLVWYFLPSFQLTTTITASMIGAFAGVCGRYCNRPSVFKLLQLFNTCCLSELRKLGYYIINCNRRRDIHM